MIPVTAVLPTIDYTRKVDNDKMYRNNKLIDQYGNTIMGGGPIMPFHPPAI